MIFKWVEMLALLGGLAYILFIVFGWINRIVAECLYRAELIAQLYTMKDLREESGDDSNPADLNLSTAPLTNATAREPKNSVVTYQTKECQLNQTDISLNAD